MDFSAGRATVQVKLNGKGPYPFVFDTGAAAGAIDARLAEELSLPVVGKERASDGKHVIEVDQVRADTMTLGEVTLKGVVLAKMELQSRFHSRIWGVIGVTQVGEELVTMDFPGQRILLQSGSLKRGSPGVAPLKPDGGIFLVEAEIGGQAVPFHLDTGSSAGITLSKQQAARLNLAKDLVQVGTARTATGEVAVWQAALPAPVKLGGLELKAERVLIIDGLATGQIGHRVLREFILTLDLKRNLLRLKRPEE